MIPVAAPSLGKLERTYVNECLKTNWISSSGRFIKEFEEKFSSYCGAKFGITTTNGTTALHLALAALEIKTGDEVIVPTFSIASVAFAVLYCGATPVFVDSEKDTWNIDPEKIEAKITSKTKAILIVHTYGHPCAMAKIKQLAKKYQLYLIEDAAEAHGAEYKNKKVGGLGDVSCFSFYSNKIITCGEGGMVVTKDKALAERCRRLRNLSFLEAKRFWHEEIGFNFRMTNLQAALGLAQFEKIEKHVARKRRMASIYKALLKDVPGLVLPIEKNYAKNVYWMYSLLVDDDFGVSRDVLTKKLKEKGIETRTFFIPMHRQPIIRKLKLDRGGKYPVAEEIAQKGLYLPSGLDLKKSEMEYVAQSIKAVRKRMS